MKSYYFAIKLSKKYIRKKDENKIRQKKKLAEDELEYMFQISNNNGIIITNTF